MHEASHCYNLGRFKVTKKKAYIHIKKKKSKNNRFPQVSFDLYIEALLSAVKEFQRLQFIDQSMYYC